MFIFSVNYTDNLNTIAWLQMVTKDNYGDLGESAFLSDSPMFPTFAADMV